MSLAGKSFRATMTGGMRSEADRLEVARGVVFQIRREHRRGDMRSHAARQQGIAVQRRRCDARASERAAGAADILDHHLVAKRPAVWSVTIRATTSLGPPAGKGTTTVMDRDG
jgi:hypothetical protein